MHLKYFQVTEVTTSSPEEVIDILATGTTVVITFTKENPTQSVSVGKTSVIACGGVSKYMVQSHLLDVYTFHQIILHNIKWHSN